MAPRVSHLSLSGVNSYHTCAIIPAYPDLTPFNVTHPPLRHIRWSPHHRLPGESHSPTSPYPVFPPHQPTRWALASLTSAYPAYHHARGFKSPHNLPGESLPTTYPVSVLPSPRVSLLTVTYPVSVLAPHLESAHSLPGEWPPLTSSLPTAYPASLTLLTLSSP